MADPVRPLVAIAGAQALAGIVGLVAEVIAVVAGSQGLAGDAAGRVVVEVLLWAFAVGGLVAIWLGLYRRRALARTPFLLVQMLMLVGVVPLMIPSDLLWFRAMGVALGVLSLAGLILGLRPSVRERLA